MKTKKRMPQEPENISRKRAKYKIGDHLYDATMGDIIEVTAIFDYLMPVAYLVKIEEGKEYITAETNLDIVH